MAKCTFCNKEFTKEKTLHIHKCEKKRRFENQNLKHVIIAFNAFNQFYENLTRVRNKKTSEEFMNSVYYLAFVRFGRYVIDVNCFNIQSYTDYVIKNQIPIDDWNTDKVYTVWLADWIYKEDHWDAATRSFETMTDWALANESSFNHYFKYATTPRIIADIQTGKVSGWIIFCSDSGRNWLQSLHSTELDYIWLLVNSDKWQKKFKERYECYLDIQHLCKQGNV